MKKLILSVLILLTSRGIDGRGDPINIQEQKVTSYQATKELYMAVISNKFSPEIFDALIKKGASTEYCPLVGIATVSTLTDVAVAFHNHDAYEFLVKKGVKQTAISITPAVREVLLDGVVHGQAQAIIEQYGTKDVLPKTWQEWIKEEHAVAAIKCARLSMLPLHEKAERSEKTIQCDRTKALDVLIKKLVQN